MPDPKPRFIEGANPREYPLHIREAVGLLGNRFTYAYDYCRDHKINDGLPEYFQAVNALARYYGQTSMLFKPQVQEEELLLIDIANKRLESCIPADISRISRMKPANEIPLPEKDAQYERGLLHYIPKQILEWLQDMLMNLPKNQIIPYANLRGGFGDLVLLSAVAEARGTPFESLRYFRMSSQNNHDFKAHMFPFEHEDIDLNSPVLIIEDVVAGGRSLPASVALFDGLGYKQIYIAVSRGVGEILDSKSDNRHFDTEFQGLETVWVPEGHDRMFSPTLMKVTDPTTLLKTYRNNLPPYERYTKLKVNS